VVDKKTLFVIAEANANFFLSSRNIPKAQVITADQLNTYDILNADQLLMTESSLQKVTNLLKD